MRQILGAMRVVSVRPVLEARFLEQGTPLSSVSKGAAPLRVNMPGYAAIGMWSFSALFISWTAEIPPMLFANLTSAVGFLFYALLWLRSPAKLRVVFQQPWRTWGLFFLAVVAYRGCYLGGLKLAPIVEANLLNYLWPLLIVFLSALLDGRRLTAKIYVGALLCFVGAVCIGLSKNGGQFSFQLGHILAVAGAVIWALYSVLTRRLPSSSRQTIGAMHLIAACLFYALHTLIETPVQLASLSWWNCAGVVEIGLAISLGYSLWDKAMTHGHRENIAVAAYYTPLLSTLWLIVFSGAPMNFYVWLAAVFILSGSWLARMAKA
ncbi:MAG: EamA family transporter [Pseudomonadota bacterium]|nr:EamA family transporter [Pseudomonadota bacterium]